MPAKARVSYKRQADYARMAARHPVDQRLCPALNGVAACLAQTFARCRYSSGFRRSPSRLKRTMLSQIRLRIRPSASITATALNTWCRRPLSNSRNPRCISASAACCRIRRPTATVVSPAMTISPSCARNGNAPFLRPSARHRRAALRPCADFRQCRARKCAIGHYAKPRQQIAPARA